MHAKTGQRTVSNGRLQREVKGQHVEVFNCDPPFYRGEVTVMAAIAGIELYTNRDGGDSHRHTLGVELGKPTFDVQANTVSVPINKIQGVVVQSVTISWIAIGSA